MIHCTAEEEYDSYTAPHITLHCTYYVIYYTALHCWRRNMTATLQCNSPYTLHCTNLHCTAPHNRLYHTATHLTALHWFTLHCTSQYSTLHFAPGAQESRAKHWIVNCKEWALGNFHWTELHLWSCTAREWLHCNNREYFGVNSCPRYPVSVMGRCTLTFFVLFAGLDCFLSNWVGLYRFV